MHGLLGFAISHKKSIIKVFWVFYALLITIFLNNDAGVWAGRCALTSFIITTIPGTTRRFGIKAAIPALILVFRRQFGILMYLFATIHYYLVRGFSLPAQLFEIMGFAAFLLTSPMFLTSNDISQKKLGRWWHRVHSLSYVIVWFLFLHTILQRVSVWSVAIGLTAIFSVSSHVYYFLKR